MSPTPTIADAPLNATCSAGAAAGGVMCTLGLHWIERQSAYAAYDPRQSRRTFSSLKAETQTKLYAALEAACFEQAERL
jgi:hypothetical protein